RSAIDFIRRATNERGMFQPFFKKDFSMYLDRDFLQAVLSENLRFLLLNVTEQCNQRCAYCVYSGKYTGRRTHSNRFMTWDVARKSIDFFLARASREDRTSISFYGGEPLLKWDLIKRCVKYIHKHSTLERLTVSVGTNATLCNDETIDFLIENDIVLFISLDGPPKVHDAARVYRNGRGTHGKVVDTLRRIRDKNYHYFHSRVCLLATYDENNDLLEVCRYFSNSFFRDLSVRISHIRDLDTDARSLPQSKSREYQKNLNRLMEMYLDGLGGNTVFNFSLASSVFRRVFRLLPQREIARASGMARPNRACIPGISQLFVSSDGLFYTCNHFCSPGYDIGNYQTGIEIEKVHRILETYINFCDDMCQRCWAYRLCWHCFVQALEKGHLNKKRKAENCIQEKHDIAQDLKRFIYLLENEPKAALDNKFSLKSRLQPRDSMNNLGKTERTGSRIRIDDLPEVPEMSFSEKDF
ncbi:MAG: radical SAM protein, partial [Deltaproteobacteria bacterium]|nr:radical SAM protein [Deltaproteobacteria bacterium]